MTHPNRRPLKAMTRWHWILPTCITVETSHKGDQGIQAKNDCCRYPLHMKNYKNLLHIGKVQHNLLLMIEGVLTTSGTRWLDRGRERRKQVLLNNVLDMQRWNEKSIFERCHVSLMNGERGIVDREEEEDDTEWEDDILNRMTDSSLCLRNFELILDLNEMEGPTHQLLNQILTSPFLKRMLPDPIKLPYKIQLLILD